MPVSGLGAYQQVDTYQPLERSAVRGGEQDTKSVKAEAAVSVADAATVKATATSTLSAAEAVSAVAVQNTKAVQSEVPSSAGFSVQSVIAARQNVNSWNAVGTHFDAQI